MEISSYENIAIHYERETRKTSIPFRVLSLYPYVNNIYFRESKRESTDKYRLSAFLRLSRSIFFPLSLSTIARLDQAARLFTKRNISRIGVRYNV